MGRAVRREAPGLLSGAFFILPVCVGFWWVSLVLVDIPVAMLIAILVMLGHLVYGIHTLSVATNKVYDDLRASRLEGGRNLSHLEHALLSDGVPARGQVLGFIKGGVAIRYKTPGGESVERVVEPFRASSLKGVEVDSELSLLIDPRSPVDCVAPALVEAHFEAEGAPAADLRPAILEPAPLVQVDVREPLTFSLFETRQVFRASVWRRFGRSRRKVVEVGALVLGPTSLKLSDEVTGEVVVDLTRPFGVALSVWLVGEGEANLSVSVRSRGAEADTPSLVFQVRLPQASVGRELPLKQGVGPFLKAEDFDRCWPALRFLAAAHGLEPTGVSRAYSEADSSS